MVEWLAPKLAVLLVLMIPVIAAAFALSIWRDSRTFAAVRVALLFIGVVLAVLRDHPILLVMWTLILLITLYQLALQKE